MISEEYEYYRREMVKRNNQGNFWSMSNEVLAKDYYEEAIKEFPNLKMCQVRSCQYFWMNHKAEEKLKTIIQNCITKMETETAELYSALKIIEDGLEDKEPQKGQKEQSIPYMTEKQRTMIQGMDMLLHKFSRYPNDKRFTVAEIINASNAVYNNILNAEEPQKAVTQKRRSR